MAEIVSIMNQTNETVCEYEIDDFWIITFKDLNDDYKMYITWRNEDDTLTINSDDTNEYNLTIATFDKLSKQFISNYGEIDSILSLKDLIVTYGEIKEYYRTEEINIILEKYSKNYINLIEKENVKKLNLKYR